jgi:hypothetical protein
MTLSRRRAEPATPEGRAVLQTVVPPAFPAPLCPEAYRAHRNSDFPREQLRARGVGPSVTGASPPDRISQRGFCRLRRLAFDSVHQRSQGSALRLRSEGSRGAQHGAMDGGRGVATG